MRADLKAGELAAPAVAASGAEALLRAQEIAPTIVALAAGTDAERRVSETVIDQLCDAGLFNIVTPRIYGGSELGFADLVRVTATIAQACGSTGWVYGVLAGHSWLLNLFPEAAAREVFQNPRALSATVFRLAGKVTPVDGGYRLVGGEGRFCSGIDHASWVIVGNAVRHPDGRVEPRFFLVPRADIEVMDDWQTVGMRGTGSKSIRIADAFIPEHRSCALADMLSGTAPGSSAHDRALYRMPFSDIAPYSIIGAPLGIAMAAVREFGGSLGKALTGKDDVVVAQASATFERLGEASADIDSAFALVLESAGWIDTATTALTPEQRARIPRDWAYAAQTCRRAVTRLFEASGGSGVYNGNPMQRLWRDSNASAQHFAFTWDSSLVNFGRLLSGAGRENFEMKGR